MSSFYKQVLNEWKATLDVKAARVIDIGGAQDPIKGMTKSWDVEDYKIMDLAIPHVTKQAPDLVQDMNHPWHPMLRTELKGEVEYRFHPIQADLIFMLGVMDYVINPSMALENLTMFMTEDGTAWVEFPFAYAHHEPLMEEGCRYSEGCINRLAKQSGLKIVEIIRKMERSGGLVRWYADEGQRMAKNYPYHGVTGFIVKFEKGS